MSKQGGKRKGKLFVITAPSGAGKTSLIEAVMRDDPTLKISVSYTTRQPRKGEADGVDYHFVDEATFERMRRRGEFLESAEVHGNHYGTAKQVILDAVKGGDDLILEIDWQDAQQVRRLYPDSCRPRSRSSSGACERAGRTPRRSSVSGCRTRARSWRMPASSNTL